MHHGVPISDIHMTFPLEVVLGISDFLMMQPWRPISDIHMTFPLEVVLDQVFPMMHHGVPSVISIGHSLSRWFWISDSYDAPWRPISDIHMTYPSRGGFGSGEFPHEHHGVPSVRKPHRCHLCPFASAYERHLEAHMRSHTGEKPYKCELCSFRCSDRSNLSHHRRRKHKIVPMKGSRSSLSNKKMWGVLQKKSSSLGYRRALINLSPPSMVVQKPDYLNDFSHEIPNIQPEAYESMTKAVQAAGLPRDPQDLMVDNPLNQLSTLAGQLSSLPPDNANPASPEGDAMQDEKPFMIQQPSAPAAASSSLAQNSSPTSPEPRALHGHRNYSPVAGPSSERSAHTSTPSISNSQPSTPAPTLHVQDPQLLHHCQHCDMYFADNILYTIHMGCHGFENPFQCNICGCKCKNKYDFACHFARGQHSHH
ncbi:LOW QUALITY PROTEIN: zinc finger protein Pegasus-like [Microcaecilia unicolor]|uniref:Zinc finger protein Pegasus n=1 Tax=Microcaecilia unicolor TaxID=1415580 RepID=A0A6P7WPE2_9AMPH|nr:LOW QUALITY PROTEIN: zinc finger protein Pegasus-like [Microcaecilia unicolor]